MKILAIESSSLTASVAIVEDDIMVAEYTINYKKTHSQTLLPMIDEMCNLTEYQLEQIDAIAVSAGPGSFTGLRIGSATAKGLGFALNKPLIHIPTVEAMAYNLCYTNEYIIPIMDARRGQVYTGIYKGMNGKIEEVEEQSVTMIDDLLDQAKKIQGKVIFLGDGVPVFREKIIAELGTQAEFAPAHMNRQRAGAVAELAKLYYQQGKLETAAEHTPDYLRLSQAERERKEKDGQE